MVPELFVGEAYDCLMAIPDERLSTTQLPAPFLSPDNEELPAHWDKERGPIALNDPSESLEYQVWLLKYDPATGNFTIEAPNTAATVVLNVMNVTEISLAFDQNANPFIAFVENGDAKYYWWDTALPGYRISSLPAGSVSPRCCTDDKRQSQSGSSDIILSYVEGTALKYRQERDRYTIAYTLIDPLEDPNGFPATLKRVGMGTQNRLQWLCTTGNPNN